MKKQIADTEEVEIKKGTLFLVSTPIGNDDDITLRALKVLKNCDIVVCEEPKVGARTLHKYNLQQKMELLNEQNEAEKTLELTQLLLEGKNLSLVSDCGTPVFADPGLLLVKSAITNDIKINVVPGATSIMTALVRSGLVINQFLYAGFLSRLKKERASQLTRLKDEARTVVLLETPYRIMPLLEAAKLILPDRQAYIGCNLTMTFETHHYGTFTELYERFSNLKFKGEFVICFEGATMEDLDKPEADLSVYLAEDDSHKPYPIIKKVFSGREGRTDSGEERSYSRSRPERDSSDDRGYSRSRPQRDSSDNRGYSRSRPDRDSSDDKGYSRNRPQRDYQPSGERSSDRDSRGRDDRKGRDSGGERNYSRERTYDRDRLSDRDSSPSRGYSRDRADSDNKFLGDRKFKSDRVNAYERKERTRDLNSGERRSSSYERGGDSGFTKRRDFRDGDSRPPFEKRERDSRPPFEKRDRDFNKEKSFSPARKKFGDDAFSNEKNYNRNESPAYDNKFKSDRKRKPPVSSPPRGRTGKTKESIRSSNKRRTK